MAFTYQNPVWPGYLADPFVLRVGGGYFAYGTGTALDVGPAGEPRAFTVLQSTDLVSWRRIGGVLDPDPSELQHAFWAPEVAAVDGRYYLYYSSAPAGLDEQHRLKVAVASHPSGPFRNVGLVFPDDDAFCIDAHPFRDPRDGRWYLFYARDYMNERTGTGLAAVPLSAGMTRAAAGPVEVLRANADWQIYERERWLYGRRWPAWHTVEGPCVVARDGRYFCFYSGGNWQTRDYGVSYAVAEHPLGPWRHAEQHGPIVLRERPPDILGPGHNSWVVAPDGRTELLVYHAWDATRQVRRMCLDPLEWTPDGPRCRGPSNGPQRVG